jgi:hypothetical protein
VDVFLEASLLFCGSYLLADAILQPMAAGTFSVVGGGMFLGLAPVLLFYLAWPGKRGSISHWEKPVQLRRGGACAEAVRVGGGKKEGLLRPI